MYLDRRARASRLGSAVAHKLHRPHLATLAVQVRLDAATRLKKAIDDTIAKVFWLGRQTRLNTRTSASMSSIQTNASREGRRY